LKLVYRLLRLWHCRLLLVHRFAFHSPRPLHRLLFELVHALFLRLYHWRCRNSFTTSQMWCGIFLQLRSLLWPKQPGTKKLAHQKHPFH
jgi:hypothetical protein